MNSHLQLNSLKDSEAPDVPMDTGALVLVRAPSVYSLPYIPPPPPPPPPLPSPPLPSFLNHVNGVPALPVSGHDEQ